MRKNKLCLIIITMLAVIMLLSTACSKDTQEALSINEIVGKHYDQDFDYTSVQINRSNSDGSTTKVTFLGEYEHNPYKEHVTVDHDNSDYTNSLWSEYTLSGSGNTVQNEIVQSDGSTVVQHVKRSYYSGYGEDITYTFVEETELDGVTVSVYSGEYTVDIAEMCGIDDDIKAVITQEYYIDHSENQIVKIVTHLEDYTYKYDLANYMNLSSKTYEEAKEYYADNPPVSYRISEEITFYNFK